VADASRIGIHAFIVLGEGKDSMLGVWIRWQCLGGRTCSVIKHRAWRWIYEVDASACLETVLAALLDTCRSMKLQVILRFSQLVVIL